MELDALIRMPPPRNLDIAILDARYLDPPSLAMPPRIWYPSPAGRVQRPPLPLKGGLANCNRPSVGFGIDTLALRAAAGGGPGS